MRCPHVETALKMTLLVQKVKEQKDSIGGKPFSIVRPQINVYGNRCGLNGLFWGSTRFGRAML